MLPLISGEILISDSGVKEAYEIYEMGKDQNTPLPVLRLQFQPFQRLI